MNEARIWGRAAGRDMAPEEQSRVPCFPERWIWIGHLAFVSIGVLVGCFGRKVDEPGLPGGLIIYQGHLLPPKGHLCLWVISHAKVNWRDHGFLVK